MKKDKNGTNQANPDRRPTPPYNEDLDPDNATSPLPFEKRQKEGEKHFYPEGGPEDPPSDESLGGS